MRRVEIERSYLGYPITSHVTFLDSGIHVMIVGGCLSHIGSISVAEPGNELSTSVFPGHKDQYVGYAYRC